jgi:hypothetical protein
MKRICVDYHYLSKTTLKMNSFAKLIAVVLLAGVCQAQEQPKKLEAPVCNSYRLQKTVSELSERPHDLLFKQRFCLYADKLVTGQALFGSAFFAGVAQFRDDPVEWGQGTKGYLRRFGTRYAQGVAKSTGEFVFSSIIREDPRYDLSKDRTFWKRTRHAFVRMVVAKNVDGANRPALSKFAGAASSGAIGLAWYPGRLNRPTDVLARSGSAFGGYLGSNIFAEFKDDIFHIVGKMLGSDRNPPPAKEDK